MNSITITILAILLGSCYSGMDDDYTYVDPLIQPHFDAFIKAAEARGVQIDTYGAKITFGKSDHDGRQGNTNHRHRIVTIDSSEYKWKNHPEGIVFHELGHLFLHREHNDYRINFNPTSIMDSHEIPEYELGRPELREYYLDELFLGNVDPPEGL